jgi:flagellin
MSHRRGKKTMSNSIHTNMGAMVALQNLKRTNTDLEDIQSRISTGLRVATAKDNGAVYNIAQQMRSEHSAYDAVTTGLNRAASTADVALAAGEKISDLLVQMREKAVATSINNISASSRAAYNDDFQSLRDQVNQYIANAVFDGGNLLDGSNDPVIPNLTGNYSFLANTTGTQTIDLPITDFRLLDTTTPGPPVPIPPAVATPYAPDQMQIEATSSLLTVDDAADVRNRIAASLEFVNSQLGRIGSAAKRIDAHMNFVSTLQDSIKGGIGNLVDADLAVESARLQAAQVRQQLGTQSLSIANQAPQSVLSLFRN